MDHISEHDEVMREIWRIKDDNAVRYPTVAALFAHLATVQVPGRVLQPRRLTPQSHTHPATPA